MTTAIKETNYAILGKPKRGKVRDMYDLGDKYAMVTTDRMSAFDVVLPDPIPDKGIVLSQISLFWFDVFRNLVDNHVITANYDEFPGPCKNYPDLAGRTIIVKKAKSLPVECVVRGFIDGSGWKSYQEDGTVCGIRLEKGLVQCERLHEPIFTPSTKEELGKHDINIDFDEMVRRLGDGNLAEQIRYLSLEIYKKGFAKAAEKGIYIADTKFEFGLIDGEVILIDEVLTPDSSRFWPKATYAPGGSQKSFDKQYLRDYLQTLDWDKASPGPKLSQEVIDVTRSKYVEALTLLTGNSHGL